jgi:prepilin-type N-terminal cleavage/methylation domain-containing protein
MKVRARMHRECTKQEDGFTLVELLVALVIMTLITGSVGAAFATAINGTRSSTQRVRESNDAQIIATYLTRDAQAAGGTSPST